MFKCLGINMLICLYDFYCCS